MLRRIMAGIVPTFLVAATIVLTPSIASAAINVADYPFNPLSSPGCGVSLTISQGSDDHAVTSTWTDSGICHAVYGTAPNVQHYDSEAYAFRVKCADDRSGANSFWTPADESTNTIVNGRSTISGTNDYGTIGCYDQTKAIVGIEMYFDDNSGDGLLNQKAATVSRIWGLDTATPTPTPSATPTPCIETAAGCTGPPTDEGGGISCSGWTDIFCHIKAALYWAFVPDSGVLNAWQDHINSLSSRGPIAAVIGGIGFIEDTVNGMHTCSDSTVAQTVATGTCYSQSSYAFAVPLDGNNSTQWDPWKSAGDFMQNESAGHAFYSLGQIAIIGTFLFWAWRRITGAVGSSE